MKRILLMLIRWYQLVSQSGVLPFGGYSGCRFWPTCSEYAKESIVTHGALVGGAKALHRVLRCNPLTAIR